MAEKVLEEAVAITLGDSKMIESRILSNEHPSSPKAEEIQKHYHNLKGKENLKKWRLGRQAGGWLLLARLSRADSMEATASVRARP